MYSGSVSARQLTNHNTTYKFLNNLPKEILIRSNHIYMHTNTCTFNVATCSPTTLTTRAVWVCSSPLSTGCSPYKNPTSRGGAGAPAPRVPMLIPATPNARVREKPPVKLHMCPQGSLLSVLRGHMKVPGGPRLLLLGPFCHKGFWGHSCSS